MLWIYPALMLASVATGVVVARRTQAPLGLTARQRLAVGIGAFCGGMIGAKLPFLFMDLDRLAGGAAWLDNGKSIVFGLVGGYFGVELAKRAAGVRVKTGDGFAVPVAAAVAVGRLACFAAGCCYGRATSLPWGVNFGDGVRRHPTQFYEAAFHLLAAVALGVLRSRGRCRGHLIKLYFIAYFAYRFLSEFIRPEPAWRLGLTAYQWASLAFAPVFVLLWVRDEKRGLQAGRAAGTVQP